MEFTFYILAGGKSSRMGEDKGLLLVNGLPMIQHVINAIAPLKCEIVILSNSDEYEQFNFPVIKDAVALKGPAGGIYTALNHSQTEQNFIVSCDVPNITKELIQLIIDAHKNVEVTVPSFDGRLHPIIGVYNKSVLPLFTIAIEENRLKIMHILEHSKFKELKLKSDAGWVTKLYFSNVNTMEDLKGLEE